MITAVEAVEVPQEPPDDVAGAGGPGEVLWRLAARLYRDHRDDDHASGHDAACCRSCRQRWPCSGRRLAELGLRWATRRG